MLMGTSEIYAAGEDVSLYLSPVKAFAGFEIRHSEKVLESRGKAGCAELAQPAKTYCI